MEITLGCKQWSWGNQYGLRFYTRGIKELGTILVYPSANHYWHSFSEFGEEVIAGKLPNAYSRYVIISDGENAIDAIATFAHHGNTFQGYITAFHGTWLFDYVTNRMNDNLQCEYLVTSDRDFILIPHSVNSVYAELDKKDEIGERKVQKFLNKHHPRAGQNIAEIGLFFELLEYDKLKSEFSHSNYKVLHRYPSIISDIPLLKQNDISCDIDVVTQEDEIKKCVEVKSVSLDEKTPFNLTIKEWTSRLWCRKNKIPYEIIIYHHFRYQSIKRVIIRMEDKLKVKPSGFYCYPV